ncbi:MAG: protease SohB [Halioglobus sp.]|nr:protease SohB [Halioglobus sp.]
MEFIYEYGLFLAQTATFVAAILIIVSVVVSLGARQRADQQEGHIEIRNLNERYRHFGNIISGVIENRLTVKEKRKADKRDKKIQDKEAKKRKKSESTEARRKRLFVLDFQGDLKATATDNLREEISAVLPRIEQGDEVLVKVESPGGLVHSYGLAASQLQRIRAAGVPLTIAVDKVAASGGYMMACVANQIVSAPFAVLGSIGVLAQLPNFHKLLQKNDIDFEVLTAGEHKRTLTMFGENTEKGRAKFIDDLEDTHVLFKDFVSSNRPSLDINKVATGEIWYGQRALDEGLVDALQTSDAFVQGRLADWDIYEVRFVHKKNWQEKLGMAAESALERAFLKIWQRGQNGKHY